MKITILAAILTSWICIGSPVAQAEALRGAGSSFAAAAYTSWGFSYAKEKNVSVIYQSTSSGDGIKQIIANTVDFGATDVPLSAAELKKNDLVQFPTLVGGAVPVFNVPGMKQGQLKMSSPVLAAIFMGRITNWNDKEIQALNPYAALPSMPIRRFVRAEASGTTSAFTEYLSKVDTDWAAKVGFGLKIEWPKGSELIKGNEALIDAVRHTPGGITVIPVYQVAASRLIYPSLQNASGKFVEPSDEALAAAVKSSGASRTDEHLSYINSSGPSAWPITDVTYVLIPRSAKNPEQLTKVLRFFYWSFLRGDAMASETGYVPLPATIQARAVAAFRQVHDGRNNPLNFMSKVPGTRLAQDRTRQASTAVAL